MKCRGLFPAIRQAAVAKGSAPWALMVVVEARVCPGIGEGQHRAAGFCQDTLIRYKNIKAFLIENFEACLGPGKGPLDWPML